MNKYITLKTTIQKEKSDTMLLWDTWDLDAKGNKSFLCVGWRDQIDPMINFWWLAYFKPRGYIDFNVLEIWKPNVDRFKEQKIPIGIRKGDIRKRLKRHYELILWHQGPEHCKEEELGKLVARKQYDKLLVTMPWGNLKQGPMYGNPYEEHISTWTKKKLLKYKPTKIAFLTKNTLVALWVRE